MTTLTKDDISNVWTNLSVDLPLSSGVPYVIQNVSPYSLEIKEKATTPSTSEFGKVITPNSFYTTTASAAIGIYIRNNNQDSKKLGRIAVDQQESIPVDIDPNVHTGKDIEGLGKVTVGTTAVQLSFTDVTESIIITSAITNTGIIYIGKSDVLSTGANAIAQLDISQSLTFDYNDATNALYVVSDTASQTIIAGAII